MPPEHDLRGELAGKVRFLCMMQRSHSDILQNVLYRSDAVGGDLTFGMRDDTIDGRVEMALERLKARRDSCRMRPALDDQVRRIAYLYRRS